VNHYPKHVGDWITATAHLSEVEECIYSRMLDQYYSREAPLPADAAAVVRLVRAVSAAARKAVPTLLREFFYLEEDGWHQKRCDEEIAAYKSKSAKAATSSAIGWRKRRSVGNANAYANASTDAMPTDMRTHSDSQSVGNANQNHEPKPRGDSGENPHRPVDNSAGENPSGDSSPKVNGNGKAKPPPGWHRTPEGIDKAGRLLGMQAKRGEDYDAFKTRIFDAIRGGPP
jgi:uncharacterized protein YdaU (DUF1376 family)